MTWVDRTGTSSSGSRSRSSLAMMRPMMSSLRPGTWMGILEYPDSTMDLMTDLSSTVSDGSMKVMVIGVIAMKAGLFDRLSAPVMIFTSSPLSSPPLPSTLPWNSTSASSCFLFMRPAWFLPIM